MKPFLALALAAIALPASAQTVSLGADLERFDYPHVVRWYETQSQGGPVRMAYMDVAPRGRALMGTVVLLHGKNFCAATWEGTITALSNLGYRVIAPDQIGFCKSSKPAAFQYSFHALASLTEGLLKQLKVGKVSVVGHSTGGMLGIRHALLHPERVERLVLVNPLGLNDTVAQGVPYADLGTLLAEEAKTDAASIKAYQQRVYYHGKWRPEYDRWVAMLAGQYASADGQSVRNAQARLSDMIQSQPVADALPNLAVPVRLLIGQKDLTAFRGNTAPEGVRDRVLTVPKAARAALPRLRDARLVEFPELGHSPQVEAPARFHAALVEALRQ